MAKTETTDPRKVCIYRYLVDNNKITLEKIPEKYKKVIEGGQ